VALEGYGIRIVRSGAVESFDGEAHTSAVCNFQEEIFVAQAFRPEGFPLWWAWFAEVMENPHPLKGVSLQAIHKLQLWLFVFACGGRGCVRLFGRGFFVGGGLVGARKPVLRGVGLLSCGWLGYGEVLAHFSSSFLGPMPLMARRSSTLLKAP